jgi:hypothetical protein
MALNTISRVHSKGDYRYEEHTADAAISPGMLLEINSDNEVLAHNSASTVGECLFAMEDALQGNDLTDDYAAGDLVPCMIPVKGSVVNALLYAGTSYTVGQILESNGDGTLTTGSTYPIAVVEDSAKDLSDSAAVNTLHPVRIL